MRPSIFSSSVRVARSARHIQAPQIRMINKACPTRHIDTKNNKIQKTANFPSHGPFGRKVLQPNYLCHLMPRTENVQNQINLRKCFHQGMKHKKNFVSTAPKYQNVVGVQRLYWQILATNWVCPEWSGDSDAFANSAGVRQKRVLIPKVFTVFLQWGMHK